MFYKKKKKLHFSISHTSHDKSVSFFQYQLTVSDTTLGILNSTQFEHYLPKVSQRSCSLRAQFYKTAPTSDTNNKSKLLVLSINWL